MADNPPRKWLQFRLQSVLWLMLCIAIGIGAYRHGYDAGVADAANQRSQVGTTFAKVYNVADIVPLQKTGSGVVADLEGLAQDISRQVLPNTWDENGGSAAIAGFEANVALVVSHDQDGHERIAAYLERLRSKQPKQLLTSK
jgi:hypothetical protein